MVRTGSKMPNFCLKKIRPHVRVRSPTIKFQGNAQDSYFAINDDDQKTEKSSSFRENHQEGTKLDSVANAEELVKIVGRKVMVVVDSSIEAKNALQWALTHSIQSQDIAVLLYVKKNTSKQGDESIKEKPTKVPNFLSSMKNMCQLKRPEVQVEIAMVEGKEKGTTILEEAKKQEVALLVLGQKKQSMSMTWRMLMAWTGKPAGGGGVVEYCIQNATCMAVAVRRKSKKVGGYLITTKRQKDFWLLA